MSAHRRFIDQAAWDARCWHAVWASIHSFLPCILAFQIWATSSANHNQETGTGIASVIGILGTALLCIIAFAVAMLQKYVKTLLPERARKQRTVCLVIVLLLCSALYGVWNSNAMFPLLVTLAPACVLGLFHSIPAERICRDPYLLLPSWLTRSRGRHVHEDNQAFRDFMCRPFLHFLVFALIIAMGIVFLHVIAFAWEAHLPLFILLVLLVVVPRLLFPSLVLDRILIVLVLAIVGLVLFRSEWDSRLVAVFEGHPEQGLMGSVAVWKWWSTELYRDNYRQWFSAAGWGWWPEGLYTAHLWQWLTVIIAAYAEFVIFRLLPELVRVRLVGGQQTPDDHTHKQLWWKFLSALGRFWKWTNYAWKRLTHQRSVAHSSKGGRLPETAACRGTDEVLPEEYRHLHWKTFMNATFEKHYHSVLMGGTAVFVLPVVAAWLEPMDRIITWSLYFAGLTSLFGSIVAEFINVRALFESFSVNYVRNRIVNTLRQHVVLCPWTATEQRIAEQLVQTESLWGDPDRNVESDSALNEAFAYFIGSDGWIRIVSRRILVVAPDLANEATWFDERSCIGVLRLHVEQEKRRPFWRLYLCGLQGHPSSRSVLFDAGFHDSSLLISLSTDEDRARATAVAIDGMIRKDSRDDDASVAEHRPQPAAILSVESSTEWRYLSMRSFGKDAYFVFPAELEGAGLAREVYFTLASDFFLDHGRVLPKDKSILWVGESRIVYYALDSLWTLLQKDFQVEEIEKWFREQHVVISTDPRVQGQRYWRVLLQRCAPGNSICEPRVLDVRASFEDASAQEPLYYYLKKMLRCEKDKVVLVNASITPQTNMRIAAGVSRALKMLPHVGAHVSLVRCDADRDFGRSFTGDGNTFDEPTSEKHEPFSELVEDQVISLARMVLHGRQLERSAHSAEPQSPLPPR